MTTTKSFDYLNRLTLITNAASASGSENPAFAYAHNSANQRTAITNADSSRWVYSYDVLGQVTSGHKYWSDGTPVAGQQFDYTFDDIGNRKTAASGGDESGLRQRLQSYTANNLNQYTQRTVPGYLNVLGTATNTATVTVSHTATSRKSSYYRGEVSVANSASPLWPSVTNVAVLASGTNDYVTNWVGNVFVPRTPELFGYDADGNMTNDGRWALTWDGENRLIKMQSLSGAPSGSSNRLTFTYDQQGRRLAKTTESFVSGAWSITLSNRFVYDGWNLVAELNATNNAVINSFVWGLDLSGSLRGAGGVGGLLAVNTTNAGSHFSGYDGNGNVALLVSVSSGAASANYEYDPFGNVLRATGPMTLLNPFRFSTKYTDGESGFNYYGYRFYNAVAGRWLNRDSLEEDGGINLCVFVGNSPVSHVDLFGLQAFPGIDFPIDPSRIPLPQPPAPDPTDTGVKWCSGGKHQWVEFPGGSAGFYPRDATVCGCLWGAGEVVNPDPHAGDADKKCTTIKLDPSRFDHAKFVKCIQDRSKARSGGRVYSVLGSNCANWVGNGMRVCEDEARK